jgi:Molybdopterin oxidoreductase Fe4S4 domain
LLGGCTVRAEVENGVWVRQQPKWESPINRGTHCPKGRLHPRDRAQRAPAALPHAEIAPHITVNRALADPTIANF